MVFSFFSFIFCLHLLAEGNVELKANLDRSKVEMGDSFVLELSIESEGGVNVEAPDFPPVENFVLLNVSQSTGQKTLFVNGRIRSKRSIIYSFELQAKKTGRLALPRVSVVVDGKVMKSPSLKIDVVDAGTLPQANRGRRGRGNSPFGNFPGFDDEVEDVFEDLLRRRPRVPEPKQETNVKLNPNEAFQLRVVADKKEAFVGEQVTANYYIYIPDNFLLRSFDTVKYPNLRGFWKEDIEMAQTLQFETVIVDGRSYNRALLASYALFPIKAGTVKLDEYKAKCDVSLNGVFGFGKPRAYTKSSWAEKIKVKPLPTQGMPSNFSGAVGSYQITAQVDAKKIIAHQPFPYKLKIEGRGNAKNLELPSIAFPPSLELFDTKEESQFFKTGKSFKEFTLYLIPRADGEIEIPEIKIGVFNPANASFEEIKSGAVIINVEPGEKPQGVNPIVENDSPQPKKEKTQLPFEYEKAQMGYVALHGKWISLAVILIALGHSIVFTRRELGLGSAEAKKIEKYEARYKKLKGLMKKQDYRQLGVEATNTIYVTLNSCLDDVESGAEISKVLKKISPNLRAEVEEPLNKSLKAFQTMGFAPEEILGELKTTKKQKEYVLMMDEALRKLIKRVDS